MDTKNDRAAWLKGPAACCSNLPRSEASPRRYVLFGPPGVGKGTQAELLSARLSACQLSTEDIYRAAQAIPDSERTPAIRSALQARQRGEAVGDDDAVAMLAERQTCLRCIGGFVLEGFPRTVPQAEGLAELLARCRVKLDAALSYELPVATTVARLTGRRICRECDTVYHLVSKPPKMEGVCDRCGGRLMQRDEDRPEAIRARLAAYESDTAPVVDYYRRRNLLVKVPAEGSPESVYQRTMRLLDQRVFAYS